MDPYAVSSSFFNCISDNNKKYRVSIFDTCVANMEQLVFRFVAE